MTTLAETFLRVRGDVSVRKDVERSTRGLSSVGKKAGKDFSGGFHVSAKALVAGVGGMLATLGAKRFLSGAIEEAREAGRVSRLTTQVIKSTGGAAKVSASQVARLAESLSRKNAMDDELIQSGANLLLTFTRVRNEAGKGNDIFNQGVAIAADMSAALGKDMKSSALAVGKALNDPIKGVTALQRVGVSFTQKQRDQIKAMVESGNVMGAQKLILKELKTEFGGAGAAAADPAQRAKVAWENFKESMGNRILPIIATLSEFLTGKLLPGVDAMIEAFKEGDVTSDGLIGAFERIGVFARQVWFGVKAMVEAFKEGDVTSDGFVGTMERIGVTLRWVFNFVTGTVIPSIASFIGWLRAGSGGAKVMQAVLAALVAGFVAFKIAMAVQMAITKAFIVVQAALNAVMSLNPIGIVVVALAALAAGLVYAYKNSETFRNIVQRAWTGVRVAASVAWAIIKPIVMSFWQFLQTLGRWASWLWRNIMVPVWNGVRAAVSVAVNLVIGYIKLWIAIIRGVASVLGWLWRNVVTPVWNGIKNVISRVWNSGIWPVFRSIRDVITKTIPDAFRRGRDAISAAWTAVRNAISTTWNRYIWPIFRTVRDTITKTIPNAFRSGVNTISSWWNTLMGLLRTPINWVISYVINRGIIENINRVKKWLGVGGKPIGWVPTIGGPPASGPNRGSSSTAGLARGGVIPGYEPGRDTVPAMLSKGEGVMVPQFVKAVGKKTIYRWNALARKGALRGFARGGVAGSKDQPPIGGPLEDFNNIMKVFNNPLGWLTEKAGLGRIASKIGGSMGDIAKGAGKKIIGYGVEKLKSWLTFWEGFGGGTYLGRDPTRSISAILSVAKRFYSGARVSSGYRPGDPGWHGKGLAADLIGGGASGMAKIARGFYGMSGRLLELIHSGGGGFFVKNGKRVSSSYYRSVIGQHYNHVHVAARRDALTRTAVGGLLGSGKLAAWVSTAMAITRTPASWFAALVALAKHESGGNPRAINLWDSNAAAGHPSKGLFQTIDSTFNKYKLPGMGDIWNPIHNAVAAIRYIKARYGTIFNIPSYRPGNRFVGGYETGGIIPQTGFAKVHRGEEVVSLPDRVRQIAIWEAILDRLERLIDATESVGPAVGRELTGGVSSARTLARSRVRPA